MKLRIMILETGTLLLLFIKNEGFKDRNFSGIKMSESGTNCCFGERKESPWFLGERRKWYFLREVYFNPGVRLFQLGGVYTWKGGTGDRSYGFCIHSSGNGKVPGVRRWYFFG